MAFIFAAFVLTGDGADDSKQDQRTVTRTSHLCQDYVTLVKPRFERVQAILGLTNTKYFNLKKRV